MSYQTPINQYIKRGFILFAICFLTEHYAHFCIVIFLHINKEKSTKKD